MANREARAKKKALMDEKMRAKTLSRATQTEGQCGAGPGKSKQTEVDAFWAAFDERKRQCEHHLTKAADVAAPADATLHFSAIEEIFGKQQSLIENAMPYLSAFDVHQAQKVVLLNVGSHLHPARRATYFSIIVPDGGYNSTQQQKIRARTSEEVSISVARENSCHDERTL